MKWHFRDRDHVMGASLVCSFHPLFLPDGLRAMRGAKKGLSVDREYDIFEKVGENELWRCSVVGLAPAKLKLKELAAKSPNQFTVMHTASDRVVWPSEVGRLTARRQTSTPRGGGAKFRPNTGGGGPIGRLIGSRRNIRL
jgi:hypothetical protein